MTLSEIVSDLLLGHSDIVFTRHGRSLEEVAVNPRGLDRRRYPKARARVDRRMAGDRNVGEETIMKRGAIR